ncbi:hypothetical protein ACWIUH_08260 [Ursidibacter arcticus]
MGFFDYKNYDKTTATTLASESSKLAIYTNAAYFMGLPGAKLLNFLGSISGSYHSNKVNIAPPKNWREIEPHELGLPQSSKDKFGYYTFESPVWGKPLITGGPQAKIFGKTDASGKITQVSMVWCGTNDLLDIADYFHLNSGKVVPPMEPLLNTLKAYAVSQGLSGEDVLVTGYSLGGGLTNLMAKYRETLADGLYKDSNYFGYASPYIYDNADVIFNMGFENDAVYRILGDKNTFKESFDDLIGFFVNPDKDFESSADNIISFNNKYASFIWSQKLVSIFNRTLGGWSAHADGVRSDMIDRIIDSEFYDYMHKDSTIIIDHLSALNRWYTWVKDKPQQKMSEGRSTFIIGNEYNNLLEGGKGHDYIEARGGNDKIKTGEGFDRVDGGTGVDTVILDGSRQNWNFYRLKDGTLFANANEKTGLKQLDNVEKIAFSKEWRSLISAYDIKEDHLQDNRYLIKSRNQKIDYKSHIEGTENDDSLTGRVVFGKEGDDQLYAHHKYGSLLHGGEGNDILIGRNGSDEIYGAEGNDYIFAGAGQNIVYGGVGNDIFAFSSQSKGRTIIRDFNSHSGDNDKLLFSKELFSSTDNALSSMKQTGNDISLTSKGVSVLIQNTLISELDYSNVGIL